MQNTTQLYKDLLAAEHSVENKLEVYDKDGTELVHTFTEEEIVSMSTSRSLFPENHPSVGGTVSCEIDCELYVKESIGTISRESTLGMRNVDPAATHPYIFYDDIKIENGQIVGVGNPTIIEFGYNAASQIPKSSYYHKYMQYGDGYYYYVTTEIAAYEWGGYYWTEVSGQRKYAISITIPRMAMLKPYIRLVSLLYQWQKWSIAGTYHWKKYAVDVNYTDRIIGNTGTKNYSHVGTPETMVMNSTPQIVVIDGEPKYDFSSGRQTVVQTDYTPVGSFCAANSDSIKTASGGVGSYQTYYAKVLSIKDNSVFEWIASSDANSEIHDIQTTRSRGTYIEDVSSTNQSSYPQNGEQGGYWYVYDGYTQERGSYIENVSSNNQSEYPQNGIQDGYWYVSMGKPVSEWLPKGVYWIDTRSTDYSSGKMTIHGYDAMLKGEVMFATETTVEDWPRTDLQVLNGFTGVGGWHDGIAQKLGVTIQPSSLALINKGYEIQFPGTVQGDDENVQGAAYTVRECLSYIMAMYGLNSTIDEDGTMRFIPLTAQTVKTTLSQNVMLFDTIPAFEAFGQVEVIVNENESVIYPTTGSGRKLTVTSPWGVQDSNVAQNIYNIVHGYAYQPFNADGAILDPAAQLGDGVSVNGVTSVLNTIGTRFSSLCSANISAPQDEEIDHEYPYESKENREITRSIASTRARLTVLSDSIAAEVTRATEAEGTLSASIALTAESITSEVTRATTAEGELSSRITQTATEVSSKVSKGSIISEINQSAEEIKISADKLTLTGLVTISALGTAGAVTINGGNITADTINANRIVANSWEGLNIGGSGGYLNNSYINTAYIRTLGLPSAGSSTLNVRLSSSGVSTDGGSTYTDWDTIKAGGGAVWG